MLMIIHTQKGGKEYMLRIYDVIAYHIGEIKKRFNKEFCNGLITKQEYDELEKIYARLEELSNKCKGEK